MRAHGWVVLATLVLSVSLAAAQQPGSAPATAPAAGAGEEAGDWFQQYSLFKEEVKKAHGFEWLLTVNYQAQGIANGPGQGKLKNAFSYDLSLGQKLWSGAWAWASVDGGSGRGIDPYAETWTGLNADAGEEACVYVNKLFLEQRLFDEKLVLMGGKLALYDFFDTNAVANCQNFQFLAGALVNNPTIPFGDSGIGAIVAVKPTDWLYAQAGVADAQARATEMGVNTAFHDEDYAFSIYEFGLTPKFGELQGNYRFIYWYDPQDLERFDSGTKRDDMGFALSFDQQVTEKITLFCRYGYAHPEAREIEHFWSVGGELAGPLEGRPDDVWGLGVAQSVSSHDFRRAEGVGPHETVFETYYNIKLTDYLYLTPNVQAVLKPGFDRDADVGVALGVRLVAQL